MIKYYSRLFLYLSCEPSVSTSRGGKGPLTPITCAAFTGNVECIALLLQAGADVENKARVGECQCRQLIRCLLSGVDGRKSRGDGDSGEGLASPHLFGIKILTSFLSFLRG